jgi:hypothetical protein
MSRASSHIGRVAIMLALLAPTGAGHAADQEVVASVGNFHLLGRGPSRAVLGLGVFNAFQYDPDDVVPAAHVNFYYGGKLWGIGPVVGVMANVEGGVYGFGGLYLDVRIGDRWVLTPFLGAGAYHQGGSRDLGGTFQFRPSVTLAYEFDSGLRVGLNYAHLSNAYLYDTNPSEEEFHISFSFPLGF